MCNTDEFVTGIAAQNEPSSSSYDMTGIASIAIQCKKLSDSSSVAHWVNKHSSSTLDDGLNAGGWTSFWYSPDKALCDARTV